MTEKNNGRNDKRAILQNPLCRVFKRRKRKMLVTVLKSKIHRATVTESQIEYQGSITIDARLIEQAGLIVNEKVLVANLKNGIRVETYVLEGKRDSGIICMNGAAAHRFTVGDLVIIMSFAHMSLEEAKIFKPTKIKVDANNKMII